MLKKLYHRMEAQVHSPYASAILGALFFIEAIFFVPVDPVLMMYCMHRQSKALYFATIATIASVLGGVVGYFIGYSIWETVGVFLVDHLLGQAMFEKVLFYFKEYQTMTVLIGAFTPIPYKAVTIAAGFCQLPLLPFIVWSFVGRGARFYLIAGIMYIWGAQIKQYIDRYFNLLVLLVMAICVAAYVLYKVLH